MGDIDIRIEGHAGRITLTRPEALNALSYQMCLDIDRALKLWRDDAAVTLVAIDAEGPRAFCAGGDLGEMYATGRAGDFRYGQTFWADEYRMNARIGTYPKPVVTFLQGFTMGGGVGLGCHASHRIVGETSQVSMPECLIGLVPDVGGTSLLAKAPGRIGDYLGTTGARMGPADAIYAGFADHFIPEAQWPALKAAMSASGKVEAIAGLAKLAPEGSLSHQRPTIDAMFCGETLAEILRSLTTSNDAFAAQTLTQLRRAAPLAAASTVEMLRRLRPDPDLRRALQQEYRFTYRALEHSDFLEGIRALIIDKDRNPRWRHAAAEAVTAQDVSAMLAPLGENELQLDEENS